MPQQDANGEDAESGPIYESVISAVTDEQKAAIAEAVIDTLSDEQRHKIATGLLGELGQVSIEQLESASPGDVQRIAASQLTLLTRFYEIALDQAKKSFRWAIVGSVVGIAFFIAAIGFLLVSGSRDAGAVSAISGAVVEVISGINFVLYGKSSTQLLGFHERLEQTQRFLLANSVCEGIEQEDARVRARSDLVATIATAAIPQTT